MNWAEVLLDTVSLLLALFSLYVLLLIHVWSYLSIHQTTALCRGEYKKQVIKKRWQNTLRSTEMNLAFVSVFLGGFLTAILPDNFKIFGLLLIIFGFIYGTHRFW